MLYPLISNRQHLGRTKFYFFHKSAHRHNLLSLALRKNPLYSTSIHGNYRIVYLMSSCLTVSIYSIFLFSKMKARIWRYCQLIVYFRCQLPTDSTYTVTHSRDNLRAVIRNFYHTTVWQLWQNPPNREQKSQYASLGGTIHTYERKHPV